jgi:hypothetical protein
MMLLGFLDGFAYPTKLRVVVRPRLNLYEPGSGFAKVFLEVVSSGLNRSTEHFQARNAHAETAPWS